MEETSIEHSWLNSRWVFKMVTLIFNLYFEYVIVNAYIDCKYYLTEFEFFQGPSFTRWTFWNSTQGISTTYPIETMTKPTYLQRCNYYIKHIYIEI